MDKAQVSEAEKLLQKLLDENLITLSQIQELLKKLQKATSTNNKKIAESKKDLFDYVDDKQELKEFLEKNESNQIILIKAAQKINSKNQSKQKQENNDEKNEEQNKAKKSAFQIEKNNMLELFKKEGEKDKTIKLESLYVYFENLSKQKIEMNDVPFFTMVFFPKEKRINLYIKIKDKMNLSFAQVDYLSNEKKLFLDIDYFSMIENCEIEKSREYKENCIDVARFEKYMKEIPLLKENETNVIYLEDNYEKLKKEIKQYCESAKNKIKSVVTNNREFFVEIVA